jgi:acyl-CoA oxidase
MLTEIGHGLDARNLETTATLLPDGDFELHTPSLAAAK